MPIATPVMPDMPTAEELSGSTNLADYIHEQLAERGRVVLPTGVITINGAIPLEKIAGGVIQGGGTHQKSLFDPTGFNDPTQADRFATVIRTTNASEPIFDLDGCSGLRLQDFGLEGDSDMLIHYHNSTLGYPSGYCLFDNLSFHPYTDTTSGKWGIQAGLTHNVENYNAADLEIHGCTFHRIGMLKVKHNQGVNFYFSGKTSCTYTPYGVLLEQGGCVGIDFLFGYGMETVLKVIGGGGNVRSNFIRFANLDRQPSLAPPVVVDFNSCTGSASCVVDLVKVTYHGTDLTSWPDRKAYLLPSNHLTNKTVIQVNNLGVDSEGTVVNQGAHTYWDYEVYVPTVASNPFE
jgi:hypothetical protein